MNAAEFMRLEAADCRLELRQGIVHERPFLDAASGCAVNLLMMEVGNFCSQDDTIIGLAGGTGFQIGRDPDTVIAPNGAFFVGNRLRNTDPNAYLALAPDIVIEARLSDMADEEMDARLDWWLHFGARMVLTLDAGRHTLTVYELDREPVTLSIEDTFSGGNVLPGFTLPVRKLFRDAG